MTQSKDSEMKARKFVSPYEGEKVLLRDLELSDVPTLMKFWNTYESRVFLYNTIPCSSMDEEEFIRSAHEQGKKRSGFIFAMVDKETNEFVGTCGLHDIDWIARYGILGIAITNPAYQNKGYGTDAMKCLLSFGFNELNLNRIELEVFDFNNRGFHVYKKVGFKEVGRRRQVRFLHGEYFDSIIMDILQEEYSS